MTGNCLLRYLLGSFLNKTMCQIAIQEEKDGKAVDWMEKVSDEQYQVVVSTE
jgi:hypothetical protein